MTKEEIFKYLWEQVDAYDLSWEPDCEKLAEQLYRDGWCRQVEAEWVPMDSFHLDTYACSKCGLCVHEDLLKQLNFCIKCGAKMTIRRASKC